MENLEKTVAQILDTYYRDCVGNRLNQFSFASLKNVILNEIKDYKPVVKEAVKEAKK